MKQHPVAFAVAYALIGAQLIAAVVAFFVIVFTPVTPVAHKSDIHDAVGAATTKQLLVIAEQRISQEAANTGLTITGQKLVRVDHPTKDEVVLRVRVTTAQYGVTFIRATFHKGIYSMTNIEAE